MFVTEDGLEPSESAILIVEDDDALRTAMAEALQAISSRVRAAARVAEAMAMLVDEEPDLVVLDLGLPDGEGAELLRALRASTNAPVIVLSGRDDEGEKVALLDAGADDFVTKPCSVAELQARVRGQLRRSATSTAARTWSHIESGGVTIDLVSQRVLRHGEPQRLTPTEWSLLRALVWHAGRPVTPRQLWDMVWAREFGDPAVHVRVHITHLRRKIEPEPSRPRLIVTVPGVGYRFEAP